MGIEEETFDKVKAVTFDGIAFTFGTKKTAKRGYVLTEIETPHSPKGMPIYLGLLSEDAVEAKAFKRAIYHGAELLDYAENRTLIRMTMYLKKCLDLTDEQNLEVLGIDDQDILHSKRIITQKIGQIARELSFDAIIFPTLEGPAIVVFKSIVDSKSDAIARVIIKESNGERLKTWIKKKFSRRRPRK